MYKREYAAAFALIPQLCPDLHERHSVLGSHRLAKHAPVNPLFACTRVHGMKRLAHFHSRHGVLCSCRVQRVPAWRHRTCALRLSATATGPPSFAFALPKRSRTVAIEPTWPSSWTAATRQTWRGHTHSLSTTLLLCHHAARRTHRVEAASLRCAASSSACACICFRCAMNALLARKSPQGSVDRRDGAAYAYFLPATLHQR